jgi:hypothetical protein
MKDTNNINDQNFDDLLRNHLLNDGTDEAFANAINKQEYNVPINKEKEKQMLDRVNRDLSNGRNGFKPFIYGGILLLFIGVMSFYFATERTKIDERNAVIILPEERKELLQINFPKTSFGDSTTIVENSSDTFGKINRMYSVIVRDTIVPIETKVEPILQLKPNAILPYLSNEDKQRYGKVKQQMLERLYKQDKDLYTHIPSDKLDYKGKEEVINAFAIRNIAITNLEYKTFLADLIVQGKAQDYYKSEVLTMKWKSESCTNLANEYFQNEMYNDFPVVNVSYDGAAVFSNWLEQELQKYIVVNKLKPFDLKIRLPLDKEWILAARNGYAKISYETGYNTIYELKEGLIDFSFVKRLNQIKKKAMLRDSVYEMYITNRYNWEEKSIKDFLARGFNGYSPTPSDTIYPDRMKLYGKIGHVSEMITQKETSKYG